MAISSRQAGAVVVCPTCGNETLVPQEDIFSSTPPAWEEAPKEEEPQTPRPPLPPLLPPIPNPPATTQPTLNIDKKPISHGESGSVSPGILSPSNKETRPDSPNELLQPLDWEKRPSAGNIHSPDADVDDSHGQDLAEELALDPFIPSDLNELLDEPIKFRRRRNPDDDMDLTPMVDVTFQLLIFFMVSASFSLQKSIEVPVPDPDQQGATQQVQTMEDLQGTSILLRIDANNGVTIDDDPVDDLGRLPDYLRDKMRREQKTELLITAHSQSMHRTVIAAVDAANEVGMQKIRMSSHKKAE